MERTQQVESGGRDRDYSFMESAAVRDPTGFNQSFIVQRFGVMPIRKSN